MEGEQSGVTTSSSGDIGGMLKPTPSRPQPSSSSMSGQQQQHLKADSPMTIASSFLNEQESEQEMKSFSHLLAGALSPQATVLEDSDGRRSPARGSFAERLAARGSANAEGLEAEAGKAPRPAGTPSNGRFRPTPNLPNPRAMGGGGDYLTIPPGLSPTTLFDPSPVLLANSQVSSLTHSLISNHAILDPSVQKWRGATCASSVPLRSIAHLFLGLETGTIWSSPAWVGENRAQAPDLTVTLNYCLDKIVRSP